MSKRAKRKGFVRTRISRNETIISYILLLLITGIGVVIYAKGQRYDPGIFTLDPSALSENRTTREQPKRLVYQEAEGSLASPGTDATGRSLYALLDDLAPAGWKTLGNVEQFTPDTLYEKINGAAEHYHDYNFIGLTFVSLVNETADNQFIDVSVFDMGRPSQAFGVFSVGRAAGLPAIALGREGYREEASYFFWKGRYYVQVLASDKGAKLEQAGLQVAGTIEKQLEDDDEPIWGLTALPETDRIPGTVQYFVANAMSLDFLKDTYIAQYLKGDAKIKVFLSKQPSPEAAANTLARYEVYLNAYGKVVGKRETNAFSLVTGDMGGVFDVVFRKGRLIGGVSMVESLSLAEKGALDFLTALGDVD